MAKQFDPEDLTYKIVSFNVMGKPVVLFNCTGEKQDLNSCPTDSEDEATAYICDYVRAYVAGKKVEASESASNIPAELESLVGKVQTAETEE